MIYIFLLVVIIFLVSLSRWAMYGAVLPRYRIKTTKTGKYVSQFLCLGKVPDLNTTSNLWGWYPLMETNKEHVSFLYKKEFESSAEVADPFIAEDIIKKFKARCKSLEEKKVTYKYIR